MKKLLFVILTLFTTISSIAQVNVSKITVKEAIQQAKQEDKLVLVMVSTTWCGPCKHVINKFFPIEEVGDYFNSNFISLKIMADVSDPEKFADNFNIKAYPTFVLINGDGKELSRVVGSASEPKEFIDKFRKALDPENTWETHEKKLKEDPSYIYTYIEILDKAYRKDEAIKLMQSVFAKQNVEQNFTAKNMEFYKNNINDFKNPIIVFMLENVDAVDKVIGQGETVKFVRGISNIIYLKLGFQMEAINVEAVDSALKEIPADKYEFLNTPTYNFLKNNRDNIAKKNYDSILNSATEAIKNINSTELDNIYIITFGVLKADAHKNMKTLIVEGYQEKFSDFLKACAENTENEKNAERYKNIIKYISK